MVVDGVMEDRVRRSIYKTEPVTLTGLESSLEARSDIAIDVGTIDEAIVEGGRPVGQGREYFHVGGLVGPVVQEQAAKILIVVGCSWTVDHYSAKDTIPGLNEEM